jgi:flagellar biosynthesis/type III secretory pathway protein FliH
VAIGGCLVDVRDGLIDATVDARLDLMELALSAAGGTQ